MRTRGLTKNRGPVMHILAFHAHVAVLDPDTGLGVLVLPQPVTDMQDWDFDGHAQPSERTLQRWFGPDADEHATILAQLASVGWELPPGYDGTHTWFQAGSTRCCGRLMISLTGVDGGDQHWPLQQLIHATKHLQAAATHACCGHRERGGDASRASAEPAAASWNQ